MTKQLSELLADINIGFLDSVKIVMHVGIANYMSAVILYIHVLVATTEYQAPACMHITYLIF